MRPARPAIVFLLAFAACSGEPPTSTASTTPTPATTPTMATTVSVSTEAPPSPSTIGTLAGAQTASTVPSPTLVLTPAAEDEWVEIVADLIELQALVGRESSFDIADRLCAPDSRCHAETVATLTYLIDNGLRLEGGPEPGPPDRVELLGSPDGAAIDEAVTMLLWVTRSVSMSTPGRLVDADGDVVQELESGDDRVGGQQFRQLWTVARSDIDSPWKLVETTTVD